MGAIMEFATEKQIASFLSTCHIEGQRNFLMAFKKKTWLKSFIDFFIIGGSYYVQSSVKLKILAFTPKGIYLMDISNVIEIVLIKSWRCSGMTLKILLIRQP